jgi:hypothetical protein
VGTGDAAERRACRAAWEKWWTANEKKLDLQARRADPRRPGLYLVSEEATWASSGKPGRTVPRNGKEPVTWTSRYWTAGCDGVSRWELPLKEKPSVGFWIPSRGHLGVIPYIAAETTDPAIKELDLHGKPIRQYPNTDQRLAYEKVVEKVLVALELEHAPAFRKGYRKLGREFFRDRIAGLRHSSCTLSFRRLGSLGGSHLCELAPDGTLLWMVHSEEGFVGGHPICALVRFGFQGDEQEWKGRGLANPRWQLGNLRSRNRTLQRVAASLLQTVPYDEHFPEAIELCLKSSDVKLREYGVDLICKAGDRIGAHVPQLLQLLDEKRDPSVANRAIFAFRHAGRDVLPRLLELLKGAAGPELAVRRSNVYAALVVGYPDSKEVIEIVRKALREEEPRYRRELASWLAYGTKHTIVFLEDLRRLIRDPDKTLASNAIKTLWWFKRKAKAAVPDLLWAMQDKDLRLEAMSSLRWVGEGDPKVLAAYADVLTESGDPKDIGSALFLMGDFGDKAKEYLDRIIPLLSDKRLANERELRYHAAWALSRIGPVAKQAIPQLLALYKEAPVSWQQELRNAIIAIDPSRSEEVAERRPPPPPEPPFLPR